MNTMGRLGSYISKGVYTVSGPFHPFGGAVDIIVVEQPDGSFKSSPWYVRFGKFQGVLKAKEKVVSISVNGVEANFCMYLDQRGEAYFLREVGGEEGEFLLSPSSSSDDTDGQSLKTPRPAKTRCRNFDGNLSNARTHNDEQSQKTPMPMKSKSCNFDASELSDEIDCGNRKIVARTNSRRSRIMGLVFGRRSMKEDSFPEGDDDSGVVRIGSLERAEIAANLLELRWSTNLASTQNKKGNAQRFSGLSSMLSGMGANDMPTSNDLRQMGSSACGSSDISMDNGILAEEVETGKERVENVSKPDFESLEDSVVETMTELGLLGMKEELVEKSMLQKSVLCGTRQAIHEILMNGSENSLQKAVDDAGNFPEVTCHPSQMPVVDELYHGEKLDKEHASDEKDIAIPVFGILEDDNKLDKAQSIVDCVTSQSLELGMGGIEGRTLTKVHFSGDETEEVQPETLSITSQQLQKDSVNQQADDAGCKTENLDASDTSRQTNPSLSFMNGHDDSSPEVPAAVSNLDVPVVDADPTAPLPDAVDPQSTYTTSSYRSKDENGIGELNLQNETQHTSVSVGNRKQRKVDFSLKKTPSEPISESSDEEQFLFSDLDNFKSHKIEYQAYFANGVNEEGIKETYGMRITHPEGISSSEVVHMNAFGDIQNALERSAAKLSPLGFHDDPNVDSLGVERLAKSLPSISSHIDNSFDTNINHSVSHSLDSISNPEEWPLHEHDEASSSGVNTGIDNQLMQDHFGNAALGDSSKVALASDGSWKMWPFSFRRSRSRRTAQPAPVDTGNSGSVNVPNRTISMETRDSSIKNSMKGEKDVLKPKVTKRTLRAITPTSEQLASLNLRDGRNIVTFTFCTTMLGTQEVDARIYLWKWNARIVISDVDGTITKSDVLGQFMPLVGVDWSQTGVANLFSAIKENGYQVLFLSARAISQAYHTRRFLFNLKQDGKSLPDGPVVISPDGLFPSLFREVIRRAPHEFKIACLEDIKALFPPDRNPFYAGFGNRDTDEISYIKVGIPKGKIFIINPKGEVAVNRCVDTKSYSSLHDLVHGMFPSKPSFEQEDFNSWNYWKLSPPLIDI